IWGLIQLLVNQGSILLYAIGLRFWLLYLWFAYAAAVSMTETDFGFIAKVLLKTLLVIAPLVVVQFFSPPGAFINKQLDGDVASIFRVAGDIVRTTGTFTFTAGQSIYLGLLGPIVLATISSASKLTTVKKLSIVIIASYFVAVMLSGSRTALATAIIQFVCFIVFDFLYVKKQNKKSNKFLIFGTIVLLSVLPYLLSTAVDATRERIDTANISENFADRVSTTILGEVTLDNLPFLGYGLGAGTNYAGRLSGEEFQLGEVDSTRILMEGGVLGLAFIALKLAIAVFGLKKSFRASRMSASSMPLLLWVTLPVALFMWQINGQLTINALGYLLLGLGIASLRLNTVNRLS
ncbi:MAG: hypothetical protein WA632_00210, partial [Gallionella sp.]